MDVITFISKHEDYPEFPEHYQGERMIDIYAQGPHLHDYLHEMNQQVLQHYDIMTVAEGPGTKPDNVLKLVDEQRQELHMIYHFDHQAIGVGKRYILDKDFQNLVKFKEVMTTWDEVFSERGWNTVYLGNHDFPRMVSRWANDSEKWQGSIESGYRCELHIEISGVPVSIKGQMDISSSGILTTNIIEIQVSCGIPLVGGQLESLVAQDVEKSVAKEFAFIKANLG